MRGILALVVLLAWGCNSRNQQGQTGVDQNKHDPCPPEWHAAGKEIKQVNVDNSTERVFLNDTLWFEIIGPSAYATNQHKAWIKNYRTNGRLESEGLAVYFDHPIADYQEHGKWKYYDCNGQLREEKEFIAGELINAN